MPQFRLYVNCCGVFIDEDEADELEVSENEFGEDIVMFKCPLCSHRHRSRRYAPE
jgi:hypothetical protein